MPEEPRYIQVVGEASYEEPIDFHLLDLHLEVRAAQDQTALSELEELRSRVVHALLQEPAGLTREELVDGGREVRRPWHPKPEKAGKFAVHRLKLKGRDINRLAEACHRAETLVAGNSRQTLTITSGPPVYRAESCVVDEAHRRAFDNARVQARLLAEEAGLALGPVLRIEQAGTAVRASGAMGDSDWWGDSGRFGYGLAAAAAAPQPIELESPRRTLWIRYLVRFELVERPTG